VGLGFELRVLHLQSRSQTSSLFSLFIKYFHKEKLILM
jgi:hypothetical protein